MNTFIKYAALLTLLIFLFGCATKPSERYACSIFDPWMVSIDKLSVGAKPGFYNVNNVAKRYAPAFNDEVFVPVFGKSFRDLNNTEREGIWRSMYKCHPYSMVAELSSPLRVDVDGRFKYKKSVWFRYIEDARKKPFSVVIKERENIVIAEKLAVENSIKQRQMAIKSRNSANEINWRKFGEAVGGMIKYGLDAKEAKGRKHIEQDKKFDEEGGCLTWFELTDSSTIDKVPDHIYGLDFSRLIDMLREKQWNYAMYDYTDSIYSRYSSGEASNNIQHELWSSVIEAKRAISLIQKTPLCRP